VGGGARGA